MYKYYENYYKHKDPHHRCHDIHTGFAVCKIPVAAYVLAQEGNAF
jgi:hypothetical protein